MNKELSIVIVSSPCNQQATSALQDELMVRGHTVTNLTNFSGEHCIAEGNSLLLGQDAVLFNQLTLTMAMADLVVLCAPLDHDAGCIAGMAQISGIPVAAVALDVPDDAVLEDFRTLSFIVRGCVSFWCDGMESLLQVVSEWPYIEDDASRDPWQALREAGAFTGDTPKAKEE